MKALLCQFVFRYVQHQNSIALLEQGCNLLRSVVVQVILAHIKHLNRGEIFVEYQFLEERDVFDRSIFQVYCVLSTRRRLRNQVVLHESINLLIFL